MLRCVAVCCGVAYRVDDGDRRTDAGDDGQCNRGPGREPVDEGDGEKWSADRAEVVHGSFKSECASVGVGCDDVCEERVAGRDTLRRVACRLAVLRLRRRLRGEDRGGGVAADGDRTPAGRVVRECAAAERVRRVRRKGLR